MQLSRAFAGTTLEVACALSTLFSFARCVVRQPVDSPAMPIGTSWPRVRAMVRQSSTVHTLLLTGAAGVGKTTVIRRVAEALHDRRIQGFLTEEIREEG